MLDLNVFLLSGGTRVPVHVGAVKALEQGGARVAAWAGVSGGSLVAAVFACGYSSDEAAKLMLRTDYRRLLDPSPISLIRRLGLYAGRRMQRWLDHVFHGRTFRDLDAPLSVLATDVATGEPFIFSRETTPDVKLATAVRCSTSLPGIFAIPHVDGRALVDGCFAAVTPQMLFPNPQRTSFVVRMEETEPPRTVPQSSLSRRGYVFHVANMILRNLKPLSHPELWDYHVRVPVGSAASLKFHLTPDQKRDLFDRGYNTCRNVLTDAILDIAGPYGAETGVLTEECPRPDRSHPIAAAAVLK